MSIALRYTASREDALEVCNDAFLHVFRHLGRYDRERPFRAWFRKIVVNAALDRYRQQQRHLRLVIPHEDVPEAQSEVTDALAHLRVEDLLGLLRALPEPYRMVFNLYEVEGYTHDEIAGLLGIAPGTSRSHLTRARQKLQALYRQQMGGDV